MTVHSPIEPHAEPGVATAEEDHVILEGPGGIAVTMTADAAVATGESLIEAGEEAQRHLKTK
ncbi:dethiobiotin synthetase [Sphingobium sp. B7D2B]|uniref:hypothetical protein n=1 Tax=Sphingobium sp. B7D2B TaxID=2940583 RepID=UPI002224A502|nr:hypothetical protein [Sphingobium sp. B7D2B]MCW2366307.1 dethiobiotin synthetase [Sphingobium sp. B7D2B]